LNFPAATTAKKSTALFAGQFDALVSPHQTCYTMKKSNTIEPLPPRIYSLAWITNTGSIPLLITVQRLRQNQIRLKSETHDRCRTDLTEQPKIIKIVG